MRRGFGLLGGKLGAGAALARVPPERGCEVLGGFLRGGSVKVGEREEGRCVFFLRVVRVVGWGVIGVGIVLSCLALAFGFWNGKARATGVEPALGWTWGRR